MNEVTGRQRLGELLEKVSPLAALFSIPFGLGVGFDGASAPAVRLVAILMLGLPVALYMTGQWLADAPTCPACRRIGRRGASVCGACGAALG